MLQQMLSEESCWHEWLKIEACLQGWFCIISCSAPIIKAVNLISSTLHNSLPPLLGLVCIQFCTASACAGNISVPGGCVLMSTTLTAMNAVLQFGVHKPSVGLSRESIPGLFGCFY